MRPIISWWLVLSMVLDAALGSSGWHSLFSRHACSISSPKAEPCCGCACVEFGYGYDYAGAELRRAHGSLSVVEPECTICRHFSKNLLATFDITHESPIGRVVGLLAVGSQLYLPHDYRANLPRGPP